MGSLCCCLRAPDVEEIADSDASNNGNRINNFIQNIMDKYGSLFGGGEPHAVPPSDQGASSSNSSVAVIISPDTNRSHGNTQSQHNVQIRGRDKGTGHSRVGPEPLRGRTCQLIPNLLSQQRKPIGSHCEGGSKECGSGSSVQDISEDEDDCPTCLEEYTLENPKIITKCSHHYHLSCILEWMERRETCPVCGKKMEFEETT